MTPTPGGGGLTVTATVRTTGPTGVEMEALTAVSVALLTIYDMLKAADRAWSSATCGWSKSKAGVDGVLPRELPTSTSARGDARAGRAAARRAGAAGRGERARAARGRDGDARPAAVRGLGDGWLGGAARPTCPATLRSSARARRAMAGAGRSGAARRCGSATGAAIPDGRRLGRDAGRSGARRAIGWPSATRAQSGFIRARGGGFCGGGGRCSAAGTRLDPWRIALAASAGLASVAVSARPRVALAVTGDELAAAGAVPGAWQIHDSVGPGAGRLVRGARLRRGADRAARRRPRRCRRGVGGRGVRLAGDDRRGLGRRP